jgi:hypothetical protein
MLHDVRRAPGEVTLTLPSRHSGLRLISPAVDAHSVRLGVVGGAAAVSFGLSGFWLLAELLNRTGRRRIVRGERWVGLGSAAVFLTGLLCFAWGVWIEADWLEVVEVRIETAARCALRSTAPSSR